MAEARITLLRVDDWEALYVDGELQDQAHRLGLPRALEAVTGEEVHVEWVDRDEVAAGCIERLGRFPESLLEWYALVEEERNA